MHVSHPKLSTEGTAAHEEEAGAKSPSQDPASKPFPHPALGPTAEELLSLVGDGVISTDALGTIILFNEAAGEMFGYEAQEVLGRPVEMLLPSRSRDAHHLAVLGFGAASTEARRSMGHRREVVGLKKSGEEFAAEAILSRRTMEGGQVLTVAIRDVSERKRMEEERRLVAAELSHRLKNCLAVVNSVVSLTAREAQSVEAFTDALQGRLRAIASTQQLLLDGETVGPDLRQLLEAELQPYVAENGLKIALSGPAITLPSRKAIGLTLALHELATNAAKYGALSRDGGTLTIGWSAAQQSGISVLLLRWKESGGPPVTEPARRGFGSELIERCLGRSNVERHFREGGLEVEIKLLL